MECTVKFKFSNGDTVKEVVSGLTGVITGSVKYLTGCNQHLVTIKPKDEFTEPTALWYDDLRLELVHADPIRLRESDEVGCDKVPSQGSRGM